MKPKKIISDIVGNNSEVDQGADQLQPSCEEDSWPDTVASRYRGNAAGHRPTQLIGWDNLGGTCCLYGPSRNSYLQQFKTASSYWELIYRAKPTSYCYLPPKVSAAVKLSWDNGSQQPKVTTLEESEPIKEPSPKSDLRLSDIRLFKKPF